VGLLQDSARSFRPGPSCCRVRPSAVGAPKPSSLLPPFTLDPPAHSLTTFSPLSLPCVSAFFLPLFVIFFTGSLIWPTLRSLRLCSNRPTLAGAFLRLPVTPFRARCPLLQNTKTLSFLINPPFSAFELLAFVAVHSLNTLFLVTP